MQHLTHKNASETMATTYHSTRRGYWLRFAGSAVVATFVVLGVVGIGAGYYEPDLIDPVTATLQTVSIVDAQDPELQKLLEASGIDVPVGLGDLR